MSPCLCPTPSLDYPAALGCFGPGGGQGGAALALGVLPGCGTFTRCHKVTHTHHSTHPVGGLAIHCHHHGTGGTQCVTLGTTCVLLGLPGWAGSACGTGALGKLLLPHGCQPRRSSGNAQPALCHSCARPCARRCPAGRGGPREPPGAGGRAGGRAGGTRGRHGAGAAGGAVPGAGAAEPAGDARGCPGTAGTPHRDSRAQLRALGQGVGTPRVVGDTSWQSPGWCCPDPAHGCCPPLPLPPSSPLLLSFPLSPRSWPSCTICIPPQSPARAPQAIPSLSPGLEGGCQPHLHPKPSPVLQEDTAGTEPGLALAPKVSWGWGKRCGVALLSPPTSPPGDRAGGGQGRDLQLGTCDIRRDTAQGWRCGT